MSLSVETIHRIDNVVHIALLTYRGDIVYIEPRIFKAYCTNTFNSDDDHSDLGCGGNEFTAYNSYFIANSTNKHKNNIAFQELINSSNRMKDYLKEGITFVVGDGASHDKHNRINGCTQFFNLRNLNDKFLTDKGFVKFTGVPEYLSYARRDTHDWYWRVYYRTLDEFMKYKSCSSDNLSIDNYINNNFSSLFLFENLSAKYFAVSSVKNSVFISSTILCLNKSL